VKQRRYLAAVATILVLLAAGFSATAADAHNGGPATPLNSWQGGHWWSYNGCTASPDWPFLHACIHHDGCYGRHWADRATCDGWFLNDMNATCAQVPISWLERRVCYGSASTYYGFVRAVGSTFYAAWSINVPLR
jgi:hypothetical protein